MKKIFICPKASLDLDEQDLFIAKDNLQTAYRFYGSCDDTLKGLAKMPQMGQRYPTEKKQLAGIRFLPIQGFERHLIFYIPAKDRIDVVRILYATSVARLTLLYICHPRMFLSGVQSRVSGFPTKAFGNDNVISKGIYDSAH